MSLLRHSSLGLEPTQAIQDDLKILKWNSAIKILFPNRATLSGSGEWGVDISSGQGTIYPSILLAQTNLLQVGVTEAPKICDSGTPAK